LFLIFNILLSMSSYDFLTGDILGEMVGPLLAPCLRIFLFSGLHLAWQKVDQATLCWGLVASHMGFCHAISYDSVGCD